MYSSLVQQYQSRVISPHEIIDYSTAVMQAYPAQAIQNEPFIGFKVLCRDTNAQMLHPAERLRQLDVNLGFMKGKGTILRETALDMPDGFCVITLPVPRSQVNQQINNLLSVLTILEQTFGIMRLNVVEINVSGRCHVAETERCLSGLMIPPRYMSSLMAPDNTPYRFGHVIRINDNFMCLRTRWDIKQNSVQEDLVVLSQLLSSIYH